MIPAVTPYSTNGRVNSSNPSFSSIHRMHYYVRWNDGNYYRAPEKVVRELQRYIVKMMNSDYKKAQKGINPAANQTNTPANIIKNTLVRFFKNNDPDYVTLNYKGNGYGMVRSFYPKEMPDGYGACILTGDNMQIVEEQGRGIGRVWKKANEQAEAMSSDYDISYKDAREQVIPSAQSDLRTAKDDYYTIAGNKIREILLHNNPKDSDVNIYFEPAIVDGKYVYNLADVKFISRE